MNERQWRTCVEPLILRDFLKDKLGPRKQRLFACACFRQVWHLLPDDDSRRFVELGEHHADGLLSRKDLKKLRPKIGGRPPFPPSGTDCLLEDDPQLAIQ